MSWFSRLSRIAIALICFLGCYSFASGDEKTDAKVRQLIEKLKSPNAMPEQQDGPPYFPGWTGDYDYSAQARICDTADEILKIGEAAIPELLRHLDEREYCITEMCGTGATRNHSVGNECDRIARLMLNAGVVGLWAWRGSPTGEPSGDLRIWWKKHAAQPLWQLQLNRLNEFVTQLERNLKDPPVVEVAPSKERLLEMIATAKKSIQTLKTTHKPLAIKYPRGMMLKRDSD